MENKGIKKSIILNTLYQILAIIVPLITTPYVTRILGADGLGIYSYTVSIVTYFSMFAALGTSSYGAREIARVRNETDRRSKLFWEVEILTIFTTLITLVIWGIVIILNTRYKIYFIILTLNLINVMFDISWFYTGLEEFKYIVMQNSIFKVLGALATFLFVKSSNDLNIYFLIMSGSTLLGTMSMWVYLKKFVNKPKLNELKIFRHLKQTFIYFIPTIATSIYTILDKTLIGIITQNNSENGFYEEAHKIINVMQALTFTSLNTVLGSRISYLFAQNKNEEIQRRIDKSINYILFMGFGICFGLILMADRFIPWYLGEGFQRAALFLKLMSPLILIIGISNCLGSQYYTPAGYRKESTKYIIIGAITNFILNIILIPHFWGIGAIIASLIAETVISILYVKHSRKHLTFRKIWKYGWKKLVAAIFMSIVILLIDIMIKNDICFIILGFILGVIVYLLTLMLLKDEFYYEMKKVVLDKILKGKNYESN